MSGFTTFSVHASKVLGWLAALSVAITLTTALFGIPLERTSVDSTAPNEDSDYVTVRGLPCYFLVTDSTLQHRPGLLYLLRNFLYDSGFFLCIFSSLLAVLLSITFAARCCARSVISLRQ